MSNDATIGVVLVDDHAVVRAGYRTLLEGYADIEVVAEAACGEDATRACRAAAPDVVIMDLSLPGIGGLEAIRRIRASCSDVRILVFSMHEDAVFAEQALQAGAHGFIGKSSPPEVLIDAVKQVAAGEAYLDAELAQQLAFQKVRWEGTPFSALSNREFEIFCLLAEGHSAGDIAKRLSLSNKTVANYATQIKNKLKVQTVAELARIAIRHGFITA